MLIDIHSHILPGVDDGAKDLNEAIQLAQIAVSDGITHLVATPHHANGVYVNEASSIMDKVEQLNAAIRQEGIPLMILPGQEVRIHRDLPDQLMKGTILGLNQSKHVLLELPSDSIPSYTESIIHEMLVEGFIPVIAHPERNKEMVRDIKRLQHFIDQGALAQVTTHSVTGQFGRKIHKVSLAMIRSGLIHFMATDAHHHDIRSFNMKQARLMVRKKLGEEMDARLMRNAENWWHGTTVCS